MNKYEAMAKILRFLISESTNKEYKEILNIMLQHVDGKKYVEEDKTPRFLSILYFGTNLFPYSESQYIEMAKLL